MNYKRVCQDKKLIEGALNRTLEEAENPAKFYKGARVSGIGEPIVYRRMSQLAQLRAEVLRRLLDDLE